MKVTVKRVGGKTAVVEVGAEATLQDVVDAYGREDPSFGCTVLAFKGSKLADFSKKLSEVGMADGDAVVAVGRNKKKEETKPAAAAAAPAPTPAEEKKEEKPAEKKEEAKPAEAPAAAPSAAPAAQPAQSGSSDAGVAAATAAGAFVTGDAVDETVQMIQMMGDWSPDLIKRALAAAFNNPDRAVEYLLTGQIPQVDVQPAPQPSASQQQQQQQQQGQQGGGPALSPLAQGLAAIPQWDQIRQVVRADQSKLPEMMAVLQQRDPSLFRLIQENSEEFLRLINEGLPAGAQPQTQTVTITPQDREAINRLVALGFPEQEALQAYILTNRNEELAASMLFDAADGNLPMED